MDDDVGSLEGASRKGNAVTHSVPSVSESTTGAPAEETPCQHCGLSLTKDDIWGWMHANGQYLCYDPNTGEPMSLPAQPAVP